MIDLMEARLAVAESTMANNISLGLYSDGSLFGGKIIDGLEAAVPAGTSTGRVGQATAYGGIVSNTWVFWKPYYVKDTTYTAASVQASFNTLWPNLVRGMDRPDLILVDNPGWQAYVGSLQLIQRFTSADEGKLGFPSLKYLTADVVLDGGIGGYAGDPEGDGTYVNSSFFLNTSYLHYRPHADRNMVPLSPNRRYSVNQDAEVQILAWAGNLTCSGRQFQGRIGST
jgi:hypothetical protein